MLELIFFFTKYVYLCFVTAVINDYLLLLQNFPCFWPRDLDKEVKFGPIGVKYVGCQKYPHIIIRAFSIRKVIYILKHDFPL